MLPALQAGLSALKTPQSYQGGCNREDPLHLKVRSCALGTDGLCLSCSSKHWCQANRNEFEWACGEPNGRLEPALTC